MSKQILRNIRERFQNNCYRSQIRFCWLLQCYITRGGDEDTRLEAKDTEKIRGQGQSFRGQTVSRPRTEMLETKAKDQGHSHKGSQTKKVFKKVFQAISNS